MQKLDGVMCIVMCSDIIVLIISKLSVQTRDARRAAVELAVLMRTSALLSAITAACPVIIELQLQQQQQQQQQQPSPQQPVTRLADSLIKLWGMLMEQTAASNSSTAASFLSSSSSSSNSKEALHAAAAIGSLAVAWHSIVPETGDAWTAAMIVADMLLTALFREIDTSQGRRNTAAAAAAAASSASQQLQHWQQLLHSLQLLWLLVLNQAVYAQYLQHQVQSHSSSSSSSSAPVAFPAHHEQMFAALGVTAACARERAAHNPFPDASGVNLAVLRTAVVSHAAWKQLAWKFTHSDDSNSSSSSRNQQGTLPEQQQLQTQLLTLLQPWLLLQLELLMLMTDGTCKLMLLQTITATYSIGMLLHANMGSSEATIEAFRRSLLQPVLQLALPHMQEYIAGFERSGVSTAVPGSNISSDEQREMQGEVLQKLETHWSTMLLETTAKFEGGSCAPELTAAFAAQPATCAAAFEAALRHMTTNEDTPLLAGCDAVAAAGITGRHVAAVVTAATAGAAGSDNALPQLLALAVTGTKCGSWVGKLTAAAVNDATAVLHSVEALCMRVLTAVNPSCGLEVNNNSRRARYHDSSRAAANLVQADASVIAAWIAVSARAALAAAELLLLWQALPLLQQPAAAGQLFKPFMLCASALEVLSWHLPAAGLPEDVLQELQLQQQQNAGLTEKLARLMGVAYEVMLLSVPQRHCRHCTICGSSTCRSWRVLQDAWLRICRCAGRATTPAVATWVGPVSWRWWEARAACAAAAGAHGTAAVIAR